MLQFAENALQPAPVWGRARAAMGTMCSVHVHDGAPIETIERAVDDVFVEIDRLEEMFSTFRVGSEISRVNRGELDLLDCSPEVIDVLDACTWLERESNGAFDIRPDGADGRIDPAGFVKGWAAERAAAALSRAGLSDWYVSLGGDMLTSGAPSPGVRWRIGIADPAQRDRVIATLEVGAGAVATSGTYERGQHLWDRRSGTHPNETPIASITVTGPSLAWADAFATAAFVMGERGVEWVERFDGYHAVAVRADGTLRSSAALG